MSRLKVQVWIYRNRQRKGYEVLLLRTNRKRGSFWQPVTGSVDEGESLEKAARREATEETGLSFSRKPQSLDLEFAFESRFGPARESVFGLEAPDSSDQIDLDPHEHEAWQWVTPDEAFKLLKYPSNAEGLKALLKSLGRLL